MGKQCSLKACGKLWRDDVPSKALIFTWRLLLDRISTREELFKRGVLTSTRDLCCVLCFKEIETTTHLFCRCEFTKKVWRKIVSWIRLDVDVQDDVLINFFQFGELIKGRKRRELKHLLWIAVVYNLWVARNKVLFRGEVTNVRSIVMSINIVLGDGLHLGKGAIVGYLCRIGLIALWAVCVLCNVQFL